MADVSEERNGGLGERRITRNDLEAVIRRALELYAAQSDAEDRLSESEVLRIGAELGLPAALVRQALYELPERDEPPSFVRRVFGPGSVAASRVVPGDASATLNRLQDYLTTREYLQVRRMQPGRLWLEPADDTISTVARALSRPSGRWHVARAERVWVSARQLEEGRVHVRMEVSMDNRRRAYLISGITTGSIVGLVVGAPAAVVMAAGLAEALGPVGSVIAGVAAGAAAFAAGLRATIAVTASRFKQRLEAARFEVDGLLDRLERGQLLDPPPAPWRRRLQLGLERHLPPFG